MNNSDNSTLRASQGFTIIEIMLVLAVSSIIGVAAIHLVSGRINTTNFSIGINDVQQQIQQVINETAAGYYPNDGSFTCLPSIIPGNPLTFNSNPSAQGTNSGCTFIGKVIQFDPLNNPSEFIVYPLAGNQINSSTGQVATTIAETDPTPIAPTTLNPNGANMTLTDQLLYGTDPVSMTATDPVVGVTQTSAVGFLVGGPTGQIANYDSSGDLDSGSLPLSLYYISGTSLNEDPLVEAAQMAATDPEPASSVQICFNGNNNQSGLITIGDSGELTVNLTIYSGSTC